MVHDWFDHGTPIKEKSIKVPLQRDDPLRSKMKGKCDQIVLTNDHHIPVCIDHRLLNSLKGHDQSRTVFGIRHLKSDVNSRINHHSRE